MTSPPFDATLTPAMAEIIARVAQEIGPQPDPTALPAAEGRALSRRLAERWMSPLPAMARLEERVLTTLEGRLRCLVGVPQGDVHGTILFLHGGGWAFSSPEQHGRMALTLAQDAGAAVVIPDYRLAPEHPYPAGLNDSHAALDALATTPEVFGLPPGPVVLAGDSAGANLAVTALFKAAPVSGAIKGALLFYGVYTADFSTPSYVQFHDGPGLTTPRMKNFFNWYCPPEARNDPLVAPVLASDDQLRALPPLYLTAAGIDPLLSDSHLFVERLRALGRNDPFRVEPGVIHGSLHMVKALEATDRTLREAGQAAKAMFSAS